MHRLITVLMFSFVSCQFRSVPTSNKVKNLMEKGTDSTYKREYFPNPNKSLYTVLAKYYNAPIETFFYYHDIDKKRVSEIKTFMLKKMYGHYFEFYDNGNLKRYCYYVGSAEQSSYIKGFSLDGTPQKEEGNPFVDYIQKDARELELHFSTVFFDSLSVQLSSNNNPIEKLQLKTSAMLPMLLESAIPIADSIYFLKIIGHMKSEPKVYFDTLRISR